MNVQFCDLDLAGEARAELRLSASLGWEINPDKPDTPPEVALLITGPRGGDGDTFETLLDLQLPQARAIAAAIVALADYAERATR